MHPFLDVVIVGDVMEALDSRSKHIPFRNSKLTYLLQVYRTKWIHKVLFCFLNHSYLSLRAHDYSCLRSRAHNVDWLWNSGDNQLRGRCICMHVQDSLGGNSRTMMIVTVCPTELHLDETVFTLQVRVNYLVPMVDPWWSKFPFQFVESIYRG